MATTFNVLDLIFISFTIIIVAVAFLRGFIREIFALAAWVLSFLVSYFLSPFIAKALSSYTDNQLVLEVVCRLIIFVLTFVIFIFTTGDLSKELHHKMSNMLDRSLGVLYGLVKSLIVFGFIYSIAINIFVLAAGNSAKTKPTKDHLPKWFVDAKCYNLIRFAGEAINPAVEKFISGVYKNIDSKLPKLDREPSLLDEKIKLINSQNSQKELKPSEEDLGYSKKDVEKMRHLIEIIDSKQ